MVKSWDTYTRQGIDFASTAASFGFSLVKSGTRLGFAVTRSITTTAAGITTAIVDHAVFGGGPVTRPVVGGALASAFSLAERVTLAPIVLSEYITSASLIAAHSSINVLSVIFPGESDASFSLASFINLVKREWSEPSVLPGSAPEKQYGITQIARAIVAWVALQGVTQEWQEKQWFKHLQEIRVHDVPRSPSLGRSKRRGSRIRVTSDIIYPGDSTQIIAADIGDAPPRPQTKASRFSLTPIVPAASTSIKLPPSPRPIPIRLPDNDLKQTLRRLSKMVLAGYGGASLLFFGVWQDQSTAAEEEASCLTHAIDASEAEAAGDFSGPTPNGNGSNGSDPRQEVPADSQYSWWDVLLGKHDKEIFERAANLGSPGEKAKEEITARMVATAVSGKHHMLTRFWVLTDHGRGQVVLVLRGTMSLNEIAADLTCEPEEFEPAMSDYYPDTEQEQRPEDGHIPGQFTFPSLSRTQSSSSTWSSPRYHVHAGMLRMARAMGDVGKPVQLAVQEALYHNPGYELVMCGHSLGAGVAALLGLMWADPRTCLTVRSSGLPVDRRVSVFCFAPPALTDAKLSKLANKLIVSFVHSHDVVARLSLGSVRDLKNAASWLCDANEAGNGKKAGEGWEAVTQRARRWKAGTGSAEDSHWFIAVRKTLEANMHMANMFPPGRVLWAMRDKDLHPSHRLSSSSDMSSDKLRLFEVLDVERVFSQLVFAKDMLIAHMPHQYDRALHDLL